METGNTEALDGADNGKFQRCASSESDLWGELTVSRDWVEGERQFDR